MFIFNKLFPLVYFGHVVLIRPRDWLSPCNGGKSNEKGGGPVITIPPLKFCLIHHQGTEIYTNTAIVAQKTTFKL